MSGHMKMLNYRYPGEGAIEFTEQFTEGLTRHRAVHVIKRLLKGKLHDRTDHRIKRCAHCKYYYRDKTKPNNSNTCCRECKIAYDTMNRSKKRSTVSSLKKETKRDQYYGWWLENPFWSKEYEMVKHSWKTDAPYSPEKLELIMAAKQRDEMMGGRRKPRRIVPYSGNDE
ncbi:hypothetical protein C6356_00620 [Bacillus wiedmannii]|uniref:hypothetical protein n=1 Tax=Bacillus wiedmannii TaxID=1890302 RepID=UPI000D08B22C|nr:hypothetical protein [Bacillus wiedmannii]PRT06961.1 hypothetical protein C6356_00620 [Bacillus wiedmannii]